MSDISSAFHVLQRHFTLSRKFFRMGISHSDPATAVSIKFTSFSKSLAVISTVFPESSPGHDSLGRIYPLLTRKKYLCTRGYTMTLQQPLSFAFQSSKLNVVLLLFLPHPIKSKTTRNHSKNVNQILPNSDILTYTRKWWICQYFNGISWWNISRWF